MCAVASEPGGGQKLHFFHDLDEMMKRTQRSINGGDLPHHETQTHGLPASSVVKLAEHDRRRLPRGQGPENNDDDEEAKDVHDQQ